VNGEAAVEASASEPKVTVEEREEDGLAEEVLSTSQYGKLRP
jgi:hypothetical protein